MAFVAFLLAMALQPFRRFSFLGVAAVKRRIWFCSDALTSTAAAAAAGSAP
jgi:hypothetical protein